MDKSKYKKFLKSTLRLAVPIMVGNLGAIGVGIADTMMIGNTGVDNLAAVSLGNSVTLISLFFGIGVSIGITPIIASLKDYSNIKSI